MINTNVHPISHRFEVIADYLSNLRFRQRGAPLWHTCSGWTPKLRITKFSLKKLETLLYRTVFIYWQTIISFCHNTGVLQTDGRTDGHYVDMKTVRMLRSRTVKICTVKSNLSIWESVYNRTILYATMKREVSAERLLGRLLTQRSQSLSRSQSACQCLEVLNSYSSSQVQKLMMRIAVVL